MSELIQKEQQTICKVQNESKLNNESGGWVVVQMRDARDQTTATYAIDDGEETGRGFESEKKENRETELRLVAVGQMQWIQSSYSTKNSTR